MRTKPAETWVVYETLVQGRNLAGRAVCGADEWPALQASRPGVHTLVRAGITNEGEAERLARGTAGDPVPRRGAIPAAGPKRPLLSHPVS